MGRVVPRRIVRANRHKSYALRQQHASVRNHAVDHRFSIGQWLHMNRRVGRGCSSMPAPTGGGRPTPKSCRERKFHQICARWPAVTLRCASVTSQPRGHPTGRARAGGQRLLARGWGKEDHSSPGPSIRSTSSGLRRVSAKRSLHSAGRPCIATRAALHLMAARTSVPRSRSQLQPRPDP